MIRLITFLVASCTSQVQAKYIYIGAKLHLSWWQGSQSSDLKIVLSWSVEALRLIQLIHHYPLLEPEWNLWNRVQRGILSDFSGSKLLFFLFLFFKFKLNAYKFGGWGVWTEHTIINCLDFSSCMHSKYFFLWNNITGWTNIKNTSFLGMHHCGSIYSGAEFLADLIYFATRCVT